MELALFKDILVLLGFSVVIVYLLQRLKLPSILGFLFTGVLIGPHGLSLIKEVERVELISEIGVILLLFVIGMELSIKQLVSLKKTVFIGGSLQVLFTILITDVIYHLLGKPWSEAVFVGFLFSLSSTAIVLKILQDKGEITAPHGRNALAILIFQDIIVVPMMLLTPILTGKSDDVWMSLSKLLVEIVLISIFTFITAKYVVPKFMHIIAKTRNKELFLLTIITICLVVAFLTAKIGLSLGLGAFLAGLIISESEYNHQATSIILPFRELFASIFFISVGMLMDITFFIEHIGVILLIVTIVFIIKSTVAAAAVTVLRHSPRTVILTAISLFQIGEFAFILSKVGVANGLLSAEINQYFLSVSIATMVLTPFILMSSEKIADWLLKTHTIQKINMDSAKKLAAHIDKHKQRYENHLIIIGYGINGSNLAKAAQYGHIPYVAVELNAETVKREKANGIPILYGDATQDHILHEINITGAKAVVVAISDRMATRTIIKNIRMLSQSVYLIVRSRFVKDTQELIDLGADEVIPEEFETSIQIFSLVLESFLVPEDDIERFASTIRADNYDLFKSRKPRLNAFHPARLPDFNITCIRIHTDSGALLGRPLKDLDLRAKYGVNVMAISRKGVMIDSVTPSDTLEQDDIVYLNGSPENIEKFYRMVN